MAAISASFKLKRAASAFERTCAMLWLSAIVKVRGERVRYASITCCGVILWVARRASRSMPPHRRVLWRQIGAATKRTVADDSNAIAVTPRNDLMLGSARYNVVHDLIAGDVPRPSYGNRLVEIADVPKLLTP